MSSGLTLDPKKTALVLIDLQNGVLSYDTQPYSPMEVVGRCRAMAEAFHAKDAFVVYVRVRFDDFRSVDCDHPTDLPPDPPAFLSEIVPSAGMRDGDLLLTKRHWGAFAPTSLDQELRSRGVETVILAGIATNIGVESTLREGAGLGFHFVTVEDACSTFTTDMQQFAFSSIFPRLSRVRSTDQVIEALA